MQEILEGNSNGLPFPFVVDVRNIAEAHIQAAVSPKAKGQRYLVSNADTVPNSEIIAVLKERFPGLKFKDAEQEDRKPVLDNSKVDVLFSLHCLQSVQFMHTQPVGVCRGPCLHVCATAMACLALRWFGSNCGALGFAMQCAASGFAMKTEEVLTNCVSLQVQKELGVKIIPYQDTIIDMAVTLIQNGIAKPQKK